MEIKFKDYKKITDIQGNALLENPVIGNISTHVYVPSESLGTIDSAGNSTKFAAIMLLVFNIALKILLKSAMSFIWDLVHIL